MAGAEITAAVAAEAGSVDGETARSETEGTPRPSRGDTPFVKRPWKDRPPGDRAARAGEGEFKRPFRDGGGKRDFKNKGGKGGFKGRGASKDRGSKDRGDREATFGLGARQQAVELILAVLSRRRSLDDALADLDRPGPRGAERVRLSPRDRAFARMMSATVLRRLGQIDAVIDAFLERPLSPEQVELRAILQCATAQMMFIGTAPHAAINIAVEQSRAGEDTARFDGLTNAILRRVSKEGPELIAAQDATALNMPAWLMARWTSTWGEETARLLADASLKEAPLDLSVKSDPEGWAQKLGGRVLPSGTVRIAAGGRVEDLEGYSEGEWWVQDAAAALPARLLGDITGLSVADLCAAPGGKTVELAAMGAKVTAVEVSWLRLDRIRQNLARAKLTAEVVLADVLKWAPTEAFDAVLLDAPCTATGTIRRHPDLLRLKRTEDVGKLAGIQTELLKAAASLVKPGGRLVYCTCSLEPEEGENQIGRFLAGSQMFELVPVDAAALGLPAEWVTARGYLRTMPHMLPLEPPELSGIDGFFAACLRRIG